MKFDGGAYFIGQGRFYYACYPRYEKLSVLDPRYKGYITYNDNNLGYLYAHFDGNLKIDLDLKLMFLLDGELMKNIKEAYLVYESDIFYVRRIPVSLDRSKVEQKFTASIKVEKGNTSSFSISLRLCFRKDLFSEVKLLMKQKKLMARGEMRFYMSPSVK